jgi:hypothetical protein
MHMLIPFDRIKLKRKEGVDVARSFVDYDLNVDEIGMPQCMTLQRMV